VADLCRDTMVCTEYPCITAVTHKQTHFPSFSVCHREVVYIEPNEGPSGADVLLCTFEITNSGFSSFSVLRVIKVPLQHFLINETLLHVDSTENK
jgi:hypothetical protein